MVAPMHSDELRAIAALLELPQPGARLALHEAVAELPWLARAVTELVRTPLEQWQSEHTRLFINGTPRTVCPPFASVWCEQHLHSSVQEALRQFYRRVGLELQDMPADYLGTLLECAALLDERYGELSAALWRDHLLPWLPRFTRALQAESRLALYRDLAERLRELCDEYRVATSTVIATIR